jgi:ABC-type multidrug transport system fused ATPase/permease subunit
MFFFDTTPTGRILSRFSRDIHTVDHELADALDIFVFIVFQLTVVMLTIVMITPFCKYLSSRFVFRLMIPFHLSSQSNPNITNHTWNFWQLRLRYLFLVCSTYPRWTTFVKFPVKWRDWKTLLGEALWPLCTLYYKYPCFGGSQVPPFMKVPTRNYLTLRTLH